MVTWGVGVVGGTYKYMYYMYAYCQKYIMCTCITSFLLPPLDPIDLTGDGDQDLQKALALSLQDMNQPSAGAAAISLEEQELSR